VKWAANSAVVPPPRNDKPAAENGDESKSVSIFVSFAACRIDIVVTDEVLRDVFGRYGEIADVAIRLSVKDKATGLQRGYAFICYTNTNQGVEAAIRATNEMAYCEFGEVEYKCEASRRLMNKLGTNDLPVNSQQAPSSSQTVPNVTIQHQAQHQPQHLPIQSQHQVHTSSMSQMAQYNRPNYSMEVPTLNTPSNQPLYYQAMPPMIPPMPSWPAPQVWSNPSGMADMNMNMAYAPVAHVHSHPIPQNHTMNQPHQSNPPVAYMPYQPDPRYYDMSNDHKYHQR
jgi:hypothetical protein